MAERGRHGSRQSARGRSRGCGSTDTHIASRFVRCAIYTRKSTEEGLDQAFNSLDAQREACAAYIRSQQHEGWKELPARYDDGGFSGGSMERPALATLLDDIRAGGIDTVVVYKVDRLTRSLADFAKIVDLFEDHRVSFVSVTQQFNTTTSMGRLTLNVLLSFAQFEREVTAERIRDKIAASKKKGMWMGGAVPIGYRVEDRKLVIDPLAASTVRHIFELYIDLGSVRAVKVACDRKDIVTSARTSRSGRTTGGNPFSRGHLYWLLRNPIYIGRVKHHGTTYKGEHEAIIDVVTWDAVQSMLDGHAKPRRAPNNIPSPSHFLKGRLFDEAGDPLYATQASKQGQRYFYYTSKHLVTRQADSSSDWRLPAPALDKLIFDQLVELLRDPLRMISLIYDGLGDDAAIKRLLDAASEVANALAGGDNIARRAMLEAVLDRIDLRESCVVVHLRASAIHSRARKDSRYAPDGDASDNETLAVELPVKLSRRGTGSRIVLANDDQSREQQDANLIKLVTDAHRWNRMLAEGEVSSVRELAMRESHDTSDISRTLNLAYLAPDIVEAILDGLQPVGLTASQLRRMTDLPFDWQAQRRVLGFRS